MLDNRADRGPIPSPDPQKPWWRRIQWIDVVLVIIGVVILLMLTMEMWLPHQGPE